MPGDSWSFQTTTGTATVRDGAVRVDSSPGRFLAAQRVRWRQGDRTRVALDVGSFLVVLAAVGVQLATAADVVSATSSVVLTGLTGLALLATLYRVRETNLGKTSIPLSSVTGVAIDSAELTLTIAYESGEGPLWIDRGIVEETLSFPTEADLREARESLRLKGVAVPPVADPETGEVPRPEAIDGARLCERCGSQVSSSDGACPACEYAPWETSEAT